MFRCYKKEIIMKGKVKWYNFSKGYGFIEGEDGNDYFIHRNSIPLGVRLDEGNTIQFEVKETSKGLEAIELEFN